MNRTTQRELNLQSLRYVLYARKSTEDEGSQMRSIPDQIKECMRLAEREGLTVAKVLQESKSAKKPHNRPVFTQLLEDVRRGKYDGILCWHPDRLSRNMLESGMIIDMLDNAVIKDLRFVSHQFSNDANGKMLLGMLFVFSKQYSEDLSEKVRRGTENNLAEGKSSGSPKWGYSRDDISGYYQPDHNFQYIQTGWFMRAEGASYREVLEYWLENDVHRFTKKNRKNKIPIRKTPTIASLYRIFRDPIYYGVLVQANQEVDLREISNFQPMINEELYNKVQSLGVDRTRGVALHSKKRTTFYPLRGMVFCGVCNGSKPMVVGKNRQGCGKYVLSYRCDNKQCHRSVKSVRAKYIFEELYRQLDRLSFTEHEYELYSQQIAKYTDKQLEEVRSELRSLRGKRSHLQLQLEEKSRQLPIIDRKSPAHKVIESDLEKLQSNIIDLDDRIKETSLKIQDPEKIKLAKDQFLNLLNKAADKMRAGSAVEKDMLARILFLNLTIDDEKTPSFIWREPIASMINARNISSGADERT